MPLSQDDDRSSLGQAQSRLYSSSTKNVTTHAPLESAGEHSVEHVWEADPLKGFHRQGRRHIHFARIFFGIAFLFFLSAVGVAAYLFYYGSNSVSVNNVSVAVQGPTTIASGDTVSLSLTITNRNSVAINNAAIEMDFPDGTRSATDVLKSYPRYVENLGSIASGQTVTRSVKAILFGAAGQSLNLPISFSYKAAGSNAVFVKKSKDAVVISSTPLSVSVDTLAETTSGKPLTLNLTVRSNAAVPIQNVVIVGNFPFGFIPTSSSVPRSDSNFLLGTFSPGETKTITLVGTLTGQDSEQRIFRFSVGTARTSVDTALSITYMTQTATVTIAAPFIATTVAINGASSAHPVVSPNKQQSVTLSYTNTLSTTVTNATVTVALSGAAIDYNSIQTTNGFYRSSDHSIIFSRDTNPSLESLAPGASGIGSFTFMTLPSTVLGASPKILFTTSVSGTRIGQSNVPEQVNASATQIIKVQTAVVLSAAALHSSSVFTKTGPIPPQVNTATTYAIVWKVQNQGSAMAGATASAILPSYIIFTNQTVGSGTITYDSTSRTVSWNIGDLSPNTTRQASFQVSFTPSSSQKGTVPIIVGQSAFSGYDRFAGVKINSSANSVTTETKGDSGYTPTDASVQ